MGEREEAAEELRTCRSITTRDSVDVDFLCSHTHITFAHERPRAHMLLDNGQDGSWYRCVQFDDSIYK